MGKQLFLLMCSPTTPHCLQILACPKEPITKLNPGYDWCDIRKAKIVLIFTIKFWETHGGVFLLMKKHLLSDSGESSFS